MRACGALLHISSIPGAGGTGCMGEDAYRFVDFLKASGQRYWQLLPLTPPARGNSPYSSFSVFAGNPYFIDPAPLAKERLLTPEDIALLPRENTGTVDFSACENLRMPLLRKAYEEGKSRYAKRLADFKEKNGFWIDDYALFMAIRTKTRQPFQFWDEPLRIRNEKALSGVRNELKNEIGFWVFAQYLFFLQWRKLKRYANQNGVKLIGDMPIYADTDSADVWANPDVFLLKKNRRPAFVAGVPPDAFSQDGQLWGNPLYDWKSLKKTGYAWWTERLKNAAVLYDAVRIDHFRGLDSYFAIPAGAKTAAEGKWRKGPGMDFLGAVPKAVPKLSLIAEDLGMLTPGVHRLRTQSGLPGMKILLFAFDPEEKSAYLPHNLPRDCVAYIGSHDNDTVQGWMKSAPPAHVKYASDYLRLSKKDAHWGFIRGLYASVSDTVIVQVQDFLGLDNTARMNIPGVAKGNWGWRVPDGALTLALAKKIASLARLYGR